MPGSVLAVIIGFAVLSVAGVVTAIVVSERKPRFVWLTSTKGYPIVWDRPLPLTLLVSAKVRPEWIHETRLQASWWNIMVGRPVFNVEVGDWETNPRASDVLVRDSLMPDSTTTLHWQEDSARRVAPVAFAELEYGTEEAARALQVRHELGHLLCLDHSDWPDDLMFPRHRQFAVSNKSLFDAAWAALRERYPT